MGTNIILICQYSALFQNVVQELKKINFRSPLRIFVVIIRKVVDVFFQNKETTNYSVQLGAYNCQKTQFFKGSEIR